MNKSFIKIKLKDVCESIFSGGTPDTRKPEYWGGKHYWLSSGETRNRFISSTEKTITQRGIDNSSTRLAKKGDVLIASAGQGKTRGQTSFVLVDTYINQSIISLRANRKYLDSLFLFYLISGKYNSLRNMSDANAIRGSLTCKMFESMELLIPEDIKIQKQISSLLYNYDSLIENNSSRIQILESIVKIVYDEWFIKFKFPGNENVKIVDSEFGKIPEGWKIKTLSEICDLISRGVTPKYKKGTKKYIINQKVNQGCLLDYKDLKELDDDMTIPEEKIAVKGDVLVNSLGEGTIGRTHYYNNNNIFAVDQHMSICRSDKLQNTLYIYFFLSSKLGQDWITSVKTGGTNMTMLNISTLRQCKILYPKDEILLNFYEIVKPLMNLKAKLDEKNQNLIVTRNLLLPKLIYGEINANKIDIKISEVST